jgi:hypothetical protein
VGLPPVPPSAVSELAVACRRQRKREDFGLRFGVLHLDLVRLRSPIWPSKLFSRFSLSILRRPHSMGPCDRVTVYPGSPLQIKHIQVPPSYPKKSNCSSLDPFSVLLPPTPPPVRNTTKASSQSPKEQTNERSNSQPNCYSVRCAHSCRSGAVDVRFDRAEDYKVDDEGD